MVHIPDVRVIESKLNLERRANRADIAATVLAGLAVNFPTFGDTQADKLAGMAVELADALIKKLSE